MDTITEILSTFFVDPAHKQKHYRPRARREVQVQTDHTTVEPVHVQTDHTTNAPEQEAKPEPVPSVQSAPSVPSAPSVQESRESSTTSTSNDSASASTSAEQSNSSSTSSRRASTTAKNSTESTSEAESSKQTTSDSPSAKSTTTDSRTVERARSPSPEPVETKVRMKRYVMKSSEVWKRNFVVVSSDASENMNVVLGRIIHSVNMMTNVVDVYDNSINVLTTRENKKWYSKMLLDNPYLYFSNFNVTSNLSSRYPFGNPGEYAKRKLVIVDFDYVNDVDRLADFVHPNVQLIVTCSTYKSTVVDIVTAVEGAIVIHRPERHMLLEHKFFKAVLGPLTGLGWDEYKRTFPSFSDYLVVIKDGGVRFN